MANPKLDIFTKEWLDLVFRGRNKSYGAYQLRRLSVQATCLGLLVVTAVVLLLSGIKWGYDLARKPSVRIDHIELPEVTLEDIELPEPKEIMEAEILPPAEQKVQQLALEVPVQDMLAFQEPEIVAQDNAQQKIHTQKELKEDKTPAKLTLKVPDPSPIVPLGESAPHSQNGTSLGVEKGVEQGDATAIIPLNALHKKPQPNEGLLAFMRWVAAHYILPDEALKRGVAGLVEINFVVEVDGSLTDIKIVRDLGFGTGNSAIGLLQMSPKWRPGEINGKPVRVAYTLPLRISTPY